MRKVHCETCGLDYPAGTVHKGHDMREVDEDFEGKHPVWNHGSVKKSG